MQRNSEIDFQNGTRRALSASETFTGKWFDVSEYSQMTILLNTDQSGSLTVQYSVDGSTVDYNFSFSHNSGGHPYTSIHIAKYVRLYYVNGSVDQTFFRMQVKHHEFQNATFSRSSMPTDPKDVSQGSYIDTGNCSTTPLSASGVFTGEWFDDIGFGQLCVIVNTDQDGTLVVQFSTNGVDVDYSYSYSHSAGGRPYSIIEAARYVRVVYMNGSVDETYFRLQTIHHVYQSSTIVSTTADGATDDIGNSTTAITSSDTSAVDAFSRWRIADTGQRLDVEFIYDKQPDFFDEITNNGSVTWNSDPRDLTLSLSNADDGSYATMQSHPVPYTPGNSQYIHMTGVLDYAGIGGGQAEYFLRSSSTGSVVDETVVQSSWNSLTTGIDWTKAHIFSIDFQSLKVGRIRYYFNQNGVATKVGEITNDNEKTYGYWQLPSLPVFWKIYNTATYTYMELGYGDTNNAVGFRYRISVNASATMKAICCTVKSEGGTVLQQIPGLSRSISSGLNDITVSNTNIPLLSIRPRSTFNSVPNMGIFIPTIYNISTDNDIYLTLVHNATLTSPSWTNVDTDNSAMEYDVSASALSGGTIVYAQHYDTNARNRGETSSGLLGKTVLWNRLSSLSGILTMAAIRLKGSNADVYSSITWTEIR